MCFLDLYDDLHHDEYDLNEIHDHNDLLEQIEQIELTEQIEQMEQHEQLVPHDFYKLEYYELLLFEIEHHGQQTI
jgi:DNA-directed RNA polymerase specialized sigma subunit